MSRTIAMGQRISTAVFGQDGPSVFENEVLDEYRLPFGDWLEQGVDWATINLGTAFDWIKWPFLTLFNLLLEGKFNGFPSPFRDRKSDPYFDTDFGMVELPWWIIVAVMGLVALFTRNGKVATFTVGALVVSALMGEEFWVEITKTIGIVLVAVFVSALAAIPLGIACGRIDALWSVVRPTLDAMQVVHSFVYMLPFIFFFGIGEVSATMVAMVFALPPLVRLTNLGIRQVPEDVVEASRSFGAPEYRVLFDVQLPLARTAIMTGLNQTLMLAFSMLGIAAIMGAGGLGRLMYRAINNQNAGLAASSGLAFFLVAVALDRISQREGDDRSFGQRFVAALTNLRTPENLLPEGEPAFVEKPAAPEVEGLSTQERAGMPIVLLGAVVAAVAVFLTWSSGSIVSSHVRASDVALGGSHSGLDATGGSWFGIVLLLSALLAFTAALNTLIRSGRGARLLSPEVTALTGGAMLGSVLGFIMVSSAGVETSRGFGVWLGLIGALLVLGGGVFATVNAPFAPHRPLPDGVQIGRVLGGLAATGLLVLGCFSYWIVDERQGTRSPEQIELLIEAKEQQNLDDPSRVESNAEDLIELRAALVDGARINLNGFTADGPKLGLLGIVLGALALLLVLPGAGMFGVASENGRRFFNVLVGATGLAVAALATGWIGSLARATDDRIVSGAGSFFVLCAGLVFLATARPVLNLFFRRKVYQTSAAEAVSMPDMEAADEPALAAV